MNLKKNLFSIGLSFFFVFSTNAQNFNYTKKITPPNTDSSRVIGDNFGNSVALSGNYAIIGAPLQNYDSIGANNINNAGAAYIWEVNNTTGAWGMRKKLSPSGTNSRDSFNFFGGSVAISGDYCIVGSRGHGYDSTGANFLSEAGAAYIWERNSVGAWTQVKKLAPPDRASNDFFGHSVAISGNFAIVGAFQQDMDSAGGNYKLNAGAVYIYERVNGIWGFTKKLTPPNIDSARVGGDNFGVSVAISGNYVVVGAFLQDWDSTGGNFKGVAGATYVFERTNGLWGYAKKLTPPNSDSARVSGDQFGNSVSIDGTTILVGAHQQDYDSTGGDYEQLVGAAYIFERINGAWGYTKKLTPPDADSARVATDQFGNSVSISVNSILIGAYRQDWDSVGGNRKELAGAAYVFEKSNGLWGYRKKLTSPDTDSARVANDQFGINVAMNGSNSLIGAVGQDWDSAGDNHKSLSGGAYFFQKAACNIEYNNGWVGDSPSNASGTCACSITGGTATIAASAALKSLVVNNGATASLSGDLNISGTYTNNGTVNGLGTIVLNGNPAQNIYGNGTTRNLQLNNFAGAIIQDSLGISGVLTLTEGTLITNGKLKLEATGANNYGQIAGTGAGTLSGTLTPEYLITSGGANWRPICAPVSGATLSQINDDVVLNFGSHSTNFATVYSFNEQTSPYWSIPSGVSSPFGDSAYSVFLGGTSSWSSPLPVMLDIQGSYRGTGDYTLANLTRTGSFADTTGWNYVANPWPSGFMWDDANIIVNSGGIQGSQVWVYNQSSGAYQVFDGIDNGVIPPFTPMLFEVITNNTSITLKNSARTTDSLVNYFDKTSLPNFIQIQIRDANGKTDKVKFYTDDKATNGYDIMDGNKRTNIEAPNLYFVLAGKKTNKEVWNSLPIESEPVKLSFEAKTAGKHTFDFVIENLEPNISVELMDLMSGAKHDVSKGNFTFVHDLTNIANRFEIRFVTKSPLSIEQMAVSPIYVGSTGNNVTIVTPQAGNYTVEILDLLGRTIQTPVTFENIANQAQIITVNNISMGYYLLKISGQYLNKTVKVVLK